MSLHIVRVIVMVIFMAASVSLASPKRRKPWPDFTCHPNHHTDEETREENVGWNENQWNDCELIGDHSSGEKRCPKACILEGNGIFTRGSDKNGGEEDITAFMNYLARSNGYEKGAGGEAAKKIMDKVREGLKKCVKDHPELKKVTTDDPCPKWNPFLSCLDKAIGC